MKNLNYPETGGSKKTDEMIQGKLGSSNLLTKIAAWISGTIAGPIISFFKKMGLKLL